MGIQISDLLPHLERKRDHRGQHFLQSLLQCPVLSHPASVSKAGDPPPDERREGGPLPLLPDSIQRLAARRATPTTPGSSSRSFRIGPTSDLSRSTEAFSKAFTELFFLPYIAAGRPGVPGTEPPAAIRDLFQKGVLSSQILGEQTQAGPKQSSWWLVLKEPCTNSKAHVSKSQHKMNKLDG